MINYMVIKLYFTCLKVHFHTTAHSALAENSHRHLPRQCIDNSLVADIALALH